MNQQIWEAIFDAERHYLYYLKLAKRYRIWNIGFHLGVMIGSFLAAITLLVNLDDWIAAVLFLVVASLTTFIMLMNFSRKASIAETAGQQCLQIRTDLIRVWRNSYDASEQGLVHRLEERLNNATGFVDINVNDGLNKKCSQDAYTWMEKNFAR